MRFLLPRRHQRKLLLPPGLLALAGLLWLGCVALGAHPEQLKQWRVMLLNMLPLDLSRSAYRGYEATWPQHLSAPAKIPAFRPWRDVQLTGNIQADAKEREHLFSSLRAIETDSLHDGGVRVQFTAAAHYVHGSISTTKKPASAGFFVA